MPFGQDRLVLLWLATQAVRKKSPVVEFGSAAEILNEWRLPTNGVYYWPLAAAFKRVFTSTIFFGTRDDRRSSEVWNCSRVHFFDALRLWFRAEGRTPGNLVILSAAFWTELQRHPIPVDADVVRMLANNPGCLDLYTWLTWRCYQAGGPERIPLFGPFGLAAPLGVHGYARQRKFRERIRGWLKLVQIYWPDSPAVVSRTGDALELSRSGIATKSRFQWIAARQRLVVGRHGTEYAAMWTSAMVTQKRPRFPDSGAGGSTRYATF
ncbi:MAG: plasmid encoded RepA protein [Bryobacterales bacterium]|nr:plasmid encoded RepA protein [Bryobacterales bacterium]